MTTESGPIGKLGHLLVELWNTVWRLAQVMLLLTILVGTNYSPDLNTQAGQWLLIAEFYAGLWIIFIPNQFGRICFVASCLPLFAYR